MRIAYTNDWDNENLIVSSENANYPGSNVQDSRLSKVWRTTGTSALAFLTVDNSSVYTDGRFASIINTNLTTAGSVTFQASTSSGFGSYNFKQLTRLNDYWYVGFPSTFTMQKRYWRVEISDTGNPDGYIEVGRVWVGDYIDVVKSVSPTFPEYRKDTSEFDQSYGGQHYGDEGIILRNYKFNFPYFNSTNKDDIVTFIEDVKKTKKFVMILDEDDMTKVKPLYCFVNRDVQFDHIYQYQWSAKISFMEAK